MKIAINLLPFRETIAGAGKYAQNIVRELSKLDYLNEYFLFISEKGKKNFEVSVENFHFCTAKFNPESAISRIFWEQLIFPFKLKKLKPDIIFTPSVAIPLLYKGTFFTAVHDLAYKYVKNKYPLLRRMYLSFITKTAVKKSDIIFTVSNFSKLAIEKEFFLKNKKILITPNGVDEIFFKEYALTEISSFKNRYKLPESFILYVGAIEPGKNLDKLIKAFNELLRMHGSGLYLVLTSGIGWKQEFLTGMIDELGIKDKIIFLPYIAEDELPILYKCSKMLAYLSDYEGFGIPVLEALAAGTPVISSRSDAILEFSDQSVLSVNTDNINDIAEGMFQIITYIDFTNVKIIQGKEIANKLKWSNSAKIIYNEISGYKE